MVSAAEVELALKQRLEAKDVTVVDDSGGCGSSFTVAVVSAQFEGRKLLDRHKLVNAALKQEMQDIHALSIKKCWTPDQQASAQNS